MAQNLMSYWLSHVSSDTVSDSKTAWGFLLFLEVSFIISKLNPGLLTVPGHHVDLRAPGGEACDAERCACMSRNRVPQEP